jgi:nanoRNase/pAp phosphatase (c-di-AMP/oligoRNAs hydrolase)
LSFNEYKTAERLKQDYWLYAVFNCGSKPELHAVQDPARLGWEPIVKIDHYHTSAKAILGAESR